VVVLVPSSIGRGHSWVTWLVFAACVVSALVAGLPKSHARTVARVIAPASAGVLIVFAIARVASASLAMGAGSVVPAGTSVSLRVGFWLALAGYILIAVGACSVRDGALPTLELTRRTGIAPRGIANIRSCRRPCAVVPICG